MEVLIVALVVAVAVVVVVFQWHVERKRSDDLASLARGLGLSFDRGRDPGADERFARFAMFRRGRSRSAWNIMRGGLAVGAGSIEVEIGDFRYTVTRGSGKHRSSRTYRFSYLVATNPVGTCPETIIRREGLFDRVKGVLGFDDIDFESDEFSRRFHVSSDDKRFAYDLVDQGMMEFLLGNPPPAIELDGALICVSDGRSRWQVEEIRRQVDWLAAFLDRWPRHLAESMADRAARGDA